ncbi:MAG TPA: hypothetical protein DD453_03810 [Alteromonas macleodii]|jgi:hypothetical protein|uniref:hypothetical protein n=1 Tax=Alteromonas TaxID=226 RepID=UPI0007765862|nr:MULTISPECIES: hypothetical protein [Alteromonas]MAL71083.1 hypothetical protein [Alteromonas sp.]MCH2191907.1 hypothetical protein [Gammaproteobacteria bacterium]MEC8451771.1 hypothetical protein [Pseudomonadota bacterium]AMN10210.1 hypothetical protein ACZ81_00605 [Alteromonas macleodii]MAW02546.1 hypothetical protein [Alteromonas sp.]|tara:strand:- start:1059 stop:1271 length:213 start_codon:yes stop_codon:yes gene_type:complete
MRVIATTVSLLLLFLFAASVLLSKQDTYIASSFNGLSVPVAAVICAAFAIGMTVGILMSNSKYNVFKSES